MRRIIYGTGFFLVLLFLSAGSLLSYQIRELKDKIQELEQSSTEAEQKVSAIPDARNQDLIFERYQEGELERDYYRITAYSSDRVVLRQEKAPETEKQEEGGFWLKVEEGYLVVYEKDSQEIFEYTNIPYESLPADLQSQVLLGKSIENLDELYSFLENYSS